MEPCIRRQRRGLNWLHGVNRLMNQGRRLSKVKSSTEPMKGWSVQSRRWRQRRVMGQKILELKPVGWELPRQHGAQFWRVVRWAGSGFALGWWLAQR